MARIDTPLPRNAPGGIASNPKIDRRNMQNSLSGNAGSFRLLLAGLLSYSISDLERHKKPWLQPNLKQVQMRETAA